MTGSFLFTDAQLVLADRVERGWLAVVDGLIVEWGTGRSPERGLDCAGDYLLPGLVELHTDHIEAHYMPRPHVRWHVGAAVLAYDAQIACAGITTVFDSLRLGGHDVGDVAQDAKVLASGIAEAERSGTLRASHFTHLRCELATADVIAAVVAFTATLPAHLISLMDHTPGQRQFRDFKRARDYFARLGVRTEEDWARLVEERQTLHAAHAEHNRRTLVELARTQAIALASHDDATADEVAEARADGVSIAEFPTTVEAAHLSHEAGIAVLMGAPNLVRGGSHVGNVAADALAREGTLDILSSDYVPGSLLHAAFDLPQRLPAIDLPAAVRLVSKNPAEAVGLHDRGEIATGKRGDLLRVRGATATPSLWGVWRAGSRVA